MARSYTPWYHLGGNLFNEGENEVRVKLLSNNHNYYAYRGKAVSSTVTVNVASAESNEEAESMDNMDMEVHDMKSMDSMDDAESTESTMDKHGYGRS